MLFDKADGKADHKDKNRKKDLPDQLQRAVFPGNGENCNGVSHVQGGADACTGVKGIDKAHQSCQYILAGKNLWPEILSVWIHNVAEHGNSLCTHDKNLQFFEVLHVGQQCIEQGADHKEKPSAVEKQKIFIKRDQIIQVAVNGVALLDRDKILCQKIKDKIYNPSS